MHNEQLELAEMTQSEQRTTRGQRGVVKKSTKQKQIDQDKLHNAFKAAKDPKGSKKRTIEFPPYFLPWFEAMNKGVPGAALTVRKLVTEFNKLKAQSVPMDRMVCSLPLFIKIYLTCVFSLYFYHPRNSPTLHHPLQMMRKILPLPKDRHQSEFVRRIAAPVLSRLPFIIFVIYFINSFLIAVNICGQF